MWCEVQHNASMSQLLVLVLLLIRSEIGIGLLNRPLSVVIMQIKGNVNYFLYSDENHSNVGLLFQVTTKKLCVTSKQY